MKRHQSLSLLSLGLVQRFLAVERIMLLMRPQVSSILFLLSLMLHAEGTRELMNGNCANHGYIQIWDNADPLRNFATYNCPEHARLYIRVAGGERIYMGFHVNDGNDGSPTIANDVWMRLRAPNGNVVMGPLQITSAMGAGWITTCNQALIGPSALFPGGYNALVYNVPAGAGGDYYIEFALNNDPNLRQKRVFRWFDITVARWNGTAWVERRGRLWSRKWDLTTRGANNAFVGTLYTYSLDSVVTSFAFNGMRPYGFEVSCNSFGASNVGTLQQRRRSDYRQSIINQGGIPAAPEYPVFLNDPDQEFFPTGRVGSVDSFSVIPCTQNSYCIYVSLTKGGQVSVTLNFPPPYAPRIFVQNLNAGPNCIPWDGRDGNGTLIPNNTLVNAQLDFFTGLTHLPLVDVEYHTNGFRVFLVRPTTRPNNTPLPDPRVYWDDALLNDPANSLDGVQNLSGCQPTPTQGCHRWQNRGTNNMNPEVINTWWYTNTEQHTFVLNVDDTKWRVFAQILSCTGQNGVQVQLRFWHEIPFSSVSWSISTNPPGLLGQASDTVIDTSDPEWTVVLLTFPVVNNGNAVTITFQVSAVSSKYPYCQDQHTLVCAVLPILWATPLRGERFPDYNLLHWATAIEAGITGFWVERSGDGQMFIPIGFVSAKGNGSTYTFRDEGASLAPRWFYRLRVEEAGGTLVYSDVIELASFHHRPHLTYDLSNRSITLWATDGRLAQVEVFSLSGQLVWRAALASGTHILPLPPGVYILRMEDQALRIWMP
ncbi:MAG: T9SS type A sorting domain-containing protein [Bacteroidia bacterium]|nr:T9SS type A sorting domain-containing protein [Bacteroidia bacterium]MDW8015307.1 T9SS type A sorting domain-containing protein [Bacteroidia bacterium]